ncbi:MAG: inner membrane protein YpjD [Acidobacteriota bacterium]
MTLILQRLALGAYGLATVLAFTSLMLKRRPTFRLVPYLALLGLLSHLVVFLGVAGSRGHLPFMSLNGALSLLTILAVSSYLYGCWRHGLHVLGVIMLPLALLLNLVSGTLPQRALPVAEGFKHTLLWLHVMVSSLGVSALGLTFTFSIIYLYQEKALKAKRPRRFFLRLPSLTGCDRALHVSLVVGFALLTLGLVMATVWSANFLGTFRVWQNKAETLALLAWLIFALVLYARLVQGWRGRKTALLVIAGFATMMLRLVGGSLL